MKGSVLYGPGDVRFEDQETPKITEPTDAVIRMTATCVCGSDLWPYRGLQQTNGPTPMGHEYCGVVEEVGSAVKTVKPGQFVVGSFATSDKHMPALPLRLPVVLFAPLVHHEGASARSSRAPSGRNARGDPRCAARRPSA